jgi:hypothetical protein
VPLKGRPEQGPCDKQQTWFQWKDSLKGIGNTLIHQVIGMKEH